MVIGLLTYRLVCHVPASLPRERRDLPRLRTPSGFLHQAQQVPVHLAPVHQFQQIIQDQQVPVHLAGTSSSKSTSTSSWYIKLNKYQYMM